MRARTFSVVAAVILAAAALAGCTVSVPVTAGTPTSEEREIGAQPEIGEEREVGDVTAVVLETSGEVTITEGEPSLVIHAGADLMPKLTSEVRDGALVLGIEPGTTVLVGDIRYDITLPAVERAEVRGSGDIRSSVSGGDLTVSIEGSGDIEFDALDAAFVGATIRGSGNIILAGRSSELRVDIDGSGTVEAAELASERVTVTVGGSGDVSVHAVNALDASIAGSGTIRYSGSPSELTSQVSGSGEIVQDD